MIKVEVAYARPDKQLILGLQAAAGITIREAIERSGILREFPEIEVEDAKVGVFSKASKLDDTLQDGDRVEIYRPLIADPKAARKKKAAKSEEGAEA